MTIYNEHKEITNEQFEHIYMLHFNELYRFAYHYIMSDDAEDLVQEVFLKLYNGKFLPSETNNLRAYLYKMTKNSCIDYLKHIDVQNKHQDQLIDSILMNLNYGEEDEPALINKVTDCLLSLPQKQKEIIKLRLDGKSYDEIAQLLNISVGTVNTHVNRAYKFIKNNYSFMLFILSNIE